MTGPSAPRVSGMHPTIRSALVLLAGVVLSFLVVILMDAVVGAVYPLPEGTNMNDQESMRRAVAAMPASAFLLLLSGWVLAAGAGAYLAARLATRSLVLHGMIVAVFVLIATVLNLAAIPHPTWLWPAAIVLIPAAGWLATRLVKS